MKYSLTILILLLFVGCKSEPKREVVISDGGGGGGGGSVQSISDSTISGFVSSIGQALIDKNGKTVDSIANDLWYTCNYKNVPLGLYIDTTTWDEQTYEVIQVRVFYDRRKIFHETFLHHGTEVWDAEIDTTFLKQKLK